MVDASPFAECFVDHLINFMDSNRPSSLPFFSLSTNYKPRHLPYSFFNPCSEIDYSQEDLCVKVDESGSVLCRLQ
jgi:hypothetical protein